MRLAHLYMDKNDFTGAENKLKKAYNCNPCEESVTELLLELYLATEQKSKAAKHFKVYASLLKEELGLAPGEKIRRLYQSIVQDN